MLANMTKEEFMQQHLNGRYIKNAIWHYLLAADKLGLDYRFYTPAYKINEKFWEIYNDKKRLQFVYHVNSLNNYTNTKMINDKVYTSQRLRENNLPAPEQVVIKEFQPIDLTYPVIVKPIDLTKGKGITANITNDEELKTGIEKVKKTIQSITHQAREKEYFIVEEMLSGNEFRFLLFNGRVIAVAQRIPATIIADGTSTISELVEAENQRVDAKAAQRICRIVIDTDFDNTLTSQGYELKSIPPKDAKVKLHTISNVSLGGMIRNMTDEVHPDFVTIVEAAGKVFNQALIGLDMIAVDITQSPTGQSHGIIELNSNPGLDLHFMPTYGEPVNVGEIILREYFDL